MVCLIIYTIGDIVAFLLGLLLAMHYQFNRKEEQQFELVVILALMSWISVALLIWKFHHEYYIFYKCTKRKILRKLMR